MPQPNQSTRIAHNLMLELAAVRRRLEAADQIIEAATPVLQLMCNNELGNFYAKRAAEPLNLIGEYNRKYGKGNA